MLDNRKVRKDFPILNMKVNNKALVYLDNSATTQKPKCVIDKLVEYYEETNSNIHRGIHYLSQKATEEYEQSKKKVAKFIGAGSYKEIIYTRNTTESINLVAFSMAGEILQKGDLVLSTEMEHHSNIVPWQMLRDKIGIVVEFVKVNDNFDIDMRDYEMKLKKKPKLVTFVHASNVLGTVNPAKEIVEKAHESGALVLVDGAQSVPHMKVDVTDMDCDLLAFSAHKMCGPTGIGVLYGKEDLLNKMEPFMGGGDMIRNVTFKNSTWNKLPWKFEAGTPNIADGIAFSSAIDYLTDIGMDDIEAYERELIEYAIGKLSKIKGLEIFGKRDCKSMRGGMISFVLKDVHSHDVSQILDDEGIAIRSGNHCAQPLHVKFGKQTTARASLYFYNNIDEIDTLGEAIKKAITVFS